MGPTEKTLDGRFCHGNCSTLLSNAVAEPEAGRKMQIPKLGERETLGGNSDQQVWQWLLGCFVFCCTIAIHNEPFIGQTKPACSACYLKDDSCRNTVRFFGKDLVGGLLGILAFHIPYLQNPLAYLGFLVGISVIAIGISPSHKCHVCCNCKGIFVIQVCTRDVVGLVFGIIAFHLPTFQDSIGYLGFLGWLSILALGIPCVTSRSHVQHVRLRRSISNMPNQHKRSKRRQKPENVRQKLHKWVAQTARLRKCVFSCRVIGQRRFKHTKHDVKHFSQFCWWLPKATQFQIRKFGVRVLVTEPQFLVPHLDWQTPYNMDFSEPKRWEQDPWQVSTLRGGAGGAASTRRKRVRWADTEDEDNLANALSGFLEQWSNRQAASKPAQRQENPLAKQLMQVLKVCINQHAPDDQVIQEVSKVINQGNQYDGCSNSRGWSTTPSRKQPRSPAASGEENLEPPRKIGKGIGSPPKPSRTVELKPPPQKGPRFAFHIEPKEWDGNAKLCFLRDIYSSLKEGSTLPGNVLVTHDPEVISEVQTLWEAHGCKEPMSIAIPTQGGHTNGPIMSIWWKPGKNKGVRPTMQRVQVHQIQEQCGPVPKTATKVTIPKKEGPVMVTLRLLTPEFYRRLFVPEADKETPTTIISRWARLAQCSVSKLTGGRWERAVYKHGSFLIAHLRISKDLASRMISHSGTDGLFATMVPSSGFPQDPVAWIPRKQAMSPEDYFKFVQGLSKSKGLPIAIRQGGQADLGLINGKQSDFPREGTRLWCIRSVPRHWQREDVEQFLHTVSWQSIEIQKRQKGRGKGAGPEWVFKASPPKDTSVEQSFFHYADEDTNLTIHANWSSQRKHPEVEWLWGPKKTWTDKDFPPLGTQNETKDTQIDDKSDMESHDHTQPTSRKPEDVDARDRSPRRKVHKPPGPSKQEPDQILLAEVPTWSILDAGGQGDCGFRSVAAALAQEQGKKLSNNGLEREGANLRVLAIQRLRSHPKFKDKWAADPEEKDSTLSAVRSFDEYLSAASKKSFWIDGLLLKGLAEKLDRNFVIFKWKRDEKYWQRFLISGKVSSKSADCKHPTVPLLLKEEHYRALLRPEQDTKTEVPEAWTCPTNEQYRGDLRGQGSRRALTEASICSEENVLILPSPDRTVSTSQP